MAKNVGAETSRREWKRRISEKPHRKVKLGKGAEPHRKRADEMVRYAEYRKKHSGGIEDAWTWVHWYHAFRRAQYRAENPPTFQAQREAALGAAQEAWRLNVEFCRCPLSQAEFMQATEVDRRWYFSKNTEIVEELEIGEGEARATRAESLQPSYNGRLD